MKEAMYYKKLRNKNVQCILCPHFCTLKPGERGKCKVRENRKGVLYSLFYGKICSASVDPIEKKPLYHFLPGTYAYSIATPGCNLSCKNCQNWEISQAKPEDIPSLSFKPEDIVKKVIKRNCKSIAYTFSEPNILIEYILDIAKIAKKQGIKNTTVTNGFINPLPLKKLCKFLDGSNIDLKSINNDFYEKICGGRLQPVFLLNVSNDTSPSTRDPSAKIHVGYPVIFASRHSCVCSFGLPDCAHSTECTFLNELPKSFFWF